MGHLAAHQRQCARAAAGFHQNVRSLLDEGHIAGVGIYGRHEVVQGIVHFTLADEDIGIRQLIIGIIGSDANNFPEGILGGGKVTAYPRLLIGCFQNVKEVPVDGSIVGIDDGKTLQQRIGLLKIAHLLIQVHLPEPEAFPVGVHFQKLIHIADGTGVVSGDFFNIHQHALGIHVMVIDTHGLHQMIAALVIRLGIPPVAAGLVLERGVVRIQFQRLIQQFLSLGPTVLGEEIGNLFHVLRRRLPAVQEFLHHLLLGRSGSREDHHHQYEEILTHRYSQG